jgi:transcription initiation factor TFIIH subunit 2
MSDSDEEYVHENASGDELPDVGGVNDYGTRSSGRHGKVRQQVAAGRSKERWEDIQRSWDLVTEGADGSLAGTVEGLLEASKRKRLMKDTTPLQRGIIRHIVILLDLSSAMSEKDLRPSRYLLSIRYAQEFITEFFEQNPISQVGIIGMRDGIAIRVSELSGNPSEHIAALQALRPQDPKGNPSLQNALEMARAALFHTPSHGTREIVIIFGALLSSDPGDIHSTIRSLVSDKIRVSVVGLAARIAICTELVSKTNGISAANSTSAYGVALHEQHFRELLFTHTTPPAIRSSDQSSAPSLLMMGFPSRIEEAHATLCACHGTASRGGYLCPRCTSKVCGLPAQCPICDLQLIQSTHLARSYHHLFPLRNYEEVSWHNARKKGSGECFACLAPFPAVPASSNGDAGPTDRQNMKTNGAKALASVVPHKPGGASESSRYRCTTCGEHFCVDCDVFAHEISHNCAGCLCRAPETPGGGQEEIDGDGESTEVNGQHMDVDGA